MEFGDARLTYSQTLARVHEAMALLAAKGVKPGDRVAVMSHNHPGNRHPLRRVGIARRDHGGPESRFWREGGALRPGSFPVERHHLLVRRLAYGSGRRGHAAGAALDHD